MKVSTDHRRSANVGVENLSDAFRIVNRGVLSSVHYSADTRRMIREGLYQPSERYPATIMPTREGGTYVGWSTPFEYTNENGAGKPVPSMIPVDVWIAARAALARRDRPGRFVTESSDGETAFAPEGWLVGTSSVGPAIVYSALEHYDDADPMREVHAGWLRAKEKDLARERAYQSAKRPSSVKRSDADRVLARLKKAGLA